MSKSIAFIMLMAMGSFPGPSADRTELDAPAVNCVPLDSTALTLAQDVVSGPDYQELRDSLPLPTLPDTAVRHIADTSICSAAAAAVAAARGIDPNLVESVAVYSLGENHFAVLSPQAPVDKWTGMLIFTHEWQLLGTLLL